MNAVFVITWKYSDNSSGGVVKAYLYREAAEADLKMLNEHCDGTRAFDLTETELKD